MLEVDKRRDQRPFKNKLSSSHLFSKKIIPFNHFFSFARSLLNFHNRYILDCPNNEQKKVAAQAIGQTLVSPFYIRENKHFDMTIQIVIVSLSSYNIFFIFWKTRGSESSLTITCWSEEMDSRAFWITRQPYICSAKGRTCPRIRVAKASF